MNTLELRLAKERGIADLGWLYSQHTFSFGHYHDPQHMGFSDLRVINEDRVQAGHGFPTHSHSDMEIFSYVLEGALEHRDSIGTGSVIRPGDVQLMSAGSGVAHSEFNHSQQEGVHFLQIWILPQHSGSQPRYQQTHFSAEQKRGQWRLMISPDGAQGSLSLDQDARIYAGLFDGAEQAELLLAENRYAYIHMARGSATINGQRLSAGDGARLRHARAIQVQAGDNAEILLFDLRP